MNLDFVRSRFPGLASGFTFMDNAGGSQALGNVADRIAHYLTHHNVQLGATYRVSDEAGQVLREATSSIQKLINAPRYEEVILGSSTTMLLRILSICLSRKWEAGDEIIVTNSDHEANVSCWTDLEACGLVIKIWSINTDSKELEIEDLQSLLTERTKLVAMVHASNILGTINDVQAIAQTVHDHGALICVDGVAFAPHRLVDVQALGVDFYVYSFYKTFGPHQAVLFGKHELLAPLEGLNHYFVGRDQMPYKFQPGNYNYELTYSLQAIPEYLQDLAQEHTGQPDLSTAFDLIAKHEEQLAERLLSYLNSRSDIRIIGQQTSDMNRRVSTISFAHENRKSSEVVSAVDPHGIGIRYGDFYAKKLIANLGLVEKDGVIRVSLVHYNTLEEVDRLVQVFEDVLN